MRNIPPHGDATAIAFVRLLLYMPPMSNMERSRTETTYVVRTASPEGEERERVFANRPAADEVWRAYMGLSHVAYAEVEAVTDARREIVAQYWNPRYWK